MNKISDIPFSPESQVVSKILAQLHKAIDQEFPEVENLEKKFSKTVFGGDSESTAIDRKPSEIIAEQQSIQVSNSHLQNTRIDLQFNDSSNTSKLNVARKGSTFKLLLVLLTLFAIAGMAILYWFSHRGDILSPP